MRYGLGYIFAQNISVNGFHIRLPTEQMPAPLLTPAPHPSVRQQGLERPASAEPLSILFQRARVLLPVVIIGARLMRSDILDKARRDLAAIQKEHASTVHRAAATVKASRQRFDAAKRRVMDLEFAAVSAEIATNKERAQERR
jgi:hypothetical protein